MKIAFLFLTITGFNHESLWVDFFKGHEEHYSLYIHSKNDFPEESPFKKHEIISKIPTTWCNTMKAQIELLRAALENPDNQKFVFLSESTIPLKSFDHVFNHLLSHQKSEFHYFVHPNAPLPRKVTKKRKLSLYKNSTWIVLNRKHAQMIVDDKDLVSLLTNDAICVDNEVYPSTFLADREQEEEIVSSNSTLVIWPKESNDGHPHIFKDLDSDPWLPILLDAIKTPEILFARKFSKSCPIDTISKYLWLPFKYDEVLKKELWKKHHLFLNNQKKKARVEFGKRGMAKFNPKSHE